MKKHKKLCLFLIPIVFFLAVILFFTVQCRTVSENIGDVNGKIFVPRGIADSYNNLLTFSIDIHTIWEYKLNSDEKEKNKQDLDNGVWKKINDESKPEITYYFTVNSDSYLPDNLSDDTYFCIYDFSMKRFIGADEDVPILGWHRALFLYDKEYSRYFCVSMSI